MSESDLQPIEDGNALVGIANGLLLVAGLALAASAVYWIGSWLLG